MIGIGAVKVNCITKIKYINKIPATKHNRHFSEQLLLILGGTSEFNTIPIREVNRLAIFNASAVTSPGNGPERWQKPRSCAYRPHVQYVKGLYPW